MADGVRFDGAESVDLVPDELASAHFVDHGIPGMIEAMPPGPERDAMRAALGPRE